VDADTEPSDRERSQNSENRPEQDEQHFGEGHAFKYAEVVDDAGADQNLEDDQEFSLSDHIGFAGFVDEFGDIEKKSVGGEFFNAEEFVKSEERSQRRHGQNHPQNAGS